MPVAFSANHDDDHGRADGHAADRPRHGCRWRGTAPARPGRGRRLDRFSTADALHYAGDLSLPRIAPGLAQNPFEAASCDSGTVPSGCFGINLVLIAELCS